MTDSISLVGLQAVGRHGVLPAERRDGQPFLVDVQLSVDTSRAAATDDLAATVDYGAVARDVESLVTGEPVDLIETLAGRIADACLAYEQVSAVRVTVHKPQAPVGVPVSDVTVTIERARRP